MMAMESQDMTEDMDKEVLAIHKILGVLGELSDDQERGRVIRFVVDRFGAGASLAANAARGRGAGAAPEGVSGSGERKFEDFPTLFQTCSPKSGPMRALVAGYWLQVCRAQRDFDGQTANNELKDLGHRASNITKDLGALMLQRPNLVMQVRKSGTTRQARKTYRLTEAGIHAVHAIMAEPDSQ